MKQTIAILFTFIHFCFIYGQHTDRFNKIVNDIQKIESKSDTIYYPNGKIWWIKKHTTYKNSSGTKTFLTGKNAQFYRNGKTLNEIEFDNYGIPLSWLEFDKNGNKTSETLTIEIDTNAKNLNEFLESDQNINIRKNVKYYKCSNKTGLFYISEKGQTINDKKSGIWINYNEDGTVKKQKEY